MTGYWYIGLVDVPIILAVYVLHRNGVSLGDIPEALTQSVKVLVARLLRMAKRDE